MCHDGARRLSMRWTIAICTQASDVFREGFVVLTQPTTPSDPRQRSLNYPSSWQHGKLMTATRTPHNLQDIARRGLNPIYQLPGVSCVSPNQSQAGETVLSACT